MVTPCLKKAISDIRTELEVRSRSGDIHAVLQRADMLCRIALPQFDWGRSCLSAEAIRLLNEVPGEIRSAIKKQKAIK